MKNSDTLNLVIKTLPYPDQIKDVDMSMTDQLRFTWRGDRFRVSDALFVEEVDSKFLVGSNTSLLLQRMLRQASEIRQISKLVNGE